VQRRLPDLPIAAARIAKTIENRAIHNSHCGISSKSSLVGPHFRAAEAVVVF
jgi:hypothetical protein